MVNWDHKLDCAPKSPDKHLTGRKMNSANIFLEDGLDLVWNKLKLFVKKLPDDCQDVFLELKTDKKGWDMFNEKSVTEF